MLQGLDPVMETIVSDLNRVTDFSNIKRMNKKWELKHSAAFGPIKGADAEMSGSDSESDAASESNSDDEIDMPVAKSASEEEVAKAV